MRRIPVEQRREELIAAALRVVTRGGVGALTTRAVASEAGMPLGSIHYIFASQDELIRAVTESIRDEERRAADDEISTAASMEDAVRAGLDAYISLLAADPTKELAVLELALHSRRREHPGLMRQQWTGYYATGAALLERAAEHAEVTWTIPIEDLSRVLIAAMDGITTTFLADGDIAATRRTAAVFATAIAAHTRPRQEDTHAD